MYPKSKFLNDKSGNRKYDYELVRQYAEEGKTLEEITYLIGASSKSTVRSILEKLGIDVESDDIDRGKIRALWKARWTIAAIAKEMELDEKTIREVLNV